jgi:uncharacterized membrane-anchored protein
MKKRTDGLGEAMVAASDSILQNITNQLVDYQWVGLGDAKKAKALMKELVEAVAVDAFKRHVRRYEIKQDGVTMRWEFASQKQKRADRSDARATLKVIQVFWNRKIAEADRG